MSLAVRERILAALASALATGVAPATCERNCEAPVTVQRGTEAVVLVDGDQLPDEEPGGYGKRTYALHALVEGYVGAAAPANVGPALSALYARVLTAAFADRTLGGLCYDVTDGPLEVEVFRAPGTACGGAFALDLVVRFATAVGDPTGLG